MSSAIKITAYMCSECEALYRNEDDANDCCENDEDIEDDGW